MPLQHNRIDLGDLHELLRYRKDDDAITTVITTDNGASTTVSDAHHPERAVEVPLTCIDGLLHGLLRHYPAPIAINGQQVERSAFDTSPAIGLLYQDLKNFPASQTWYEHISGQPDFPGQRHFQSYFLFDGLTYHESAGCQTLLTCPSQPAHYSPVHTYRISRRLVHDEPCQDERRQCEFSALYKEPFCQPSNAVFRAMSEQLQLPVDRALEHAASSGRQPLPSDARQAEAHNHTFDQYPIVIFEGVKPATINTPREQHLDYAVAIALYQQSHLNLAPVNAKTSAELDPAHISVDSVSYTDQYGIRHRLECGHATRSVTDQLRRGAHVASDIVATIVCTQSGLEQSHFIELPLSVAPFGTALYPALLVDPSAFSTEANLVDVIASCYITKQQINDDRETEVRRSLNVLATRFTQGEDAGFIAELQQYANSMNFQSASPQHPVSVPLSDGSSITWQPPAP